MKTHLNLGPDDLVRVGTGDRESFARPAREDVLRVGLQASGAGRQVSSTPLTPDRLQSFRNPQAYRRPWSTSHPILLSAPA